MKNVLLLAHDDAGQESRLQAALDVTRAIGGHLTCLDVTPLPVSLADPLMVEMNTLLLEEERQREERPIDRLRARLEHEDVSWDIRSAVGEFAPAIEDAAALSDVIVVNRTLSALARHDLKDLADKLIVASRRPVLAVPPEARGCRVGGRAIVAWDGFPACTAALRAALPLLQQAEAVIIIEIAPQMGDSSAREAAAYLSRHGIHPLIRFERPLGRSVPDILLTEIAERNADYMVMGGYGHGRLIEKVFGGVTRELLARSPVPLFLAR